MTLDKDVPQPPGGGFDAVICLGNSFAHLPDCKGERGCGLAIALALSCTPLSTEPWVPVLLPEQTLPFAPLCLGTGTPGEQEDGREAGAGDPEWTQPLCPCLTLRGPE